MTDPVIRIRGLENRFGSHVVHEGLDPIGALAFDRLMRELVAALGLTVFSRHP